MYTRNIRVEMCVNIIYTHNTFLCLHLLLVSNNFSRWRKYIFQLDLTFTDRVFFPRTRPSYKAFDTCSIKTCLHTYHVERRWRAVTSSREHPLFESHETRRRDTKNPRSPIADFLRESRTAERRGKRKKRDRELRCAQKTGKRVFRQLKLAGNFTRVSNPFDSIPLAPSVVDGAHYSTPTSRDVNLYFIYHGRWRGIEMITKN